jgi:S-disulfanyl-L-cysteine oxidoreductase SoxD
VVCAGEPLEVGGDKLIGGRGSLASGKPVKTIESYWPYATTLFDYVKRAMPLPAPGSLSDNEVYAVSAFILAEAGITGRDQAMNATTLREVVMPNRDGFVPDPRPDVHNYE